MAEKTKTEEKKAKRFYEPTCSKVVDVKEWQVDEKGHHHLVKVGEKNFDDEIQLYKDMTDIKILVDRLNNGDVATIKQLTKEGIYGDVNDYPKEYHPAAGQMALHQLYENQPEEVKKQFPTYELFASYFTNLTEAMVAELAKPKEEKKEEAVNEQ